MKSQTIQEEAINQQFCKKYKRKTSNLLNLADEIGKKGRKVLVVQQVSKGQKACHGPGSARPLGGPQQPRVSGAQATSPGTTPTRAAQGAPPSRPPQDNSSRPRVLVAVLPIASEPPTTQHDAHLQGIRYRHSSETATEREISTYHNHAS